MRRCWSELKREEPSAAHARYFVGAALLSYAAKVDAAPKDTILARTHRMLETEYRGDIPLGTWAASSEPTIVRDHLFDPGREG